MGYRILASGANLAGLGARVFSISSFPLGPGVFDHSKPFLTDITFGFAFSASPHYHYEVRIPGDSALAPGTPPFAGPGRWYVICSTTPPGGAWPNGSTRVSLYTDDSTASRSQTGTMTKSATGKTVYRANDLLMYIPDAALGNPACTVAYMAHWDVDF